MKSGRADQNLKWLALLFACFLGLTADATAAETVKSADELSRLVEGGQEGRAADYLRQR